MPVLFIDAASIAIGVCYAYAGCILLFQGGARRVRHKAVRIPQAWMGWSQMAGWAFILTALVALSMPRGVEIGVTVWLSTLAIAGIASLLVSAFMPRWHLISPLFVAVVGVTVTIPFLFEGGAA